MEFNSFFFFLPAKQFVEYNSVIMADKSWFFLKHEVFKTFFEGRFIDLCKKKKKSSFLFEALMFFSFPPLTQYKVEKKEGEYLLCDVWMKMEEQFSITNA